MIYISFDIGVKNLAYCILKEKDETINIIDWGIITLAESKKQIKGVDKLSSVLFLELDNLIGKLETLEITYIDYVVIENQPSNLNGIMKTIQYLIYSYFKLLEHWDQKVKEVILINPSLKLQFHEYKPSSSLIVGKLTKQEKYKYNKSDSIEICQNYIKNDEKLHSFFQSYKKKDDLADTCLQVISFILKNQRKVTNVVANETTFFDN
jgi:hypothetical protein